ncbi:hypothetical protein CYLTODRAFT_107746 [Cylindrobasidium torrendii FP15055 ss-10]|uniref:MARVEL domain-containing protein n=1 Tax=Cylindrobasidium torrendii FP15055 ss-10 TaxID=1314674 RepID=A0A0D7B218_9AGAR|nr:hypothetical protein CYLTODRAFT_107746 [Cylindrobasidium torrendii FP15055 ss-10]
MSTFFSCTRYAAFALSIVCSAIIASAAVWNLSLVQELDLGYPLDTYLTFLGAYGIANVFIVVSVELTFDRPFTARVWFECLWVLLLLAMNLAGAAYFTTHSPALCSAHGRNVLGNEGCTSNQVLMGFTWLNTSLLFLYLALLVVLTIVRAGSEPQVWSTYIRDISTPGFNKLISPSNARSNVAHAPRQVQVTEEKRPNVPIISIPKPKPRPRRPSSPSSGEDPIGGLRTYYDVEAYPHDPQRHGLASSTILPPSDIPGPVFYSQHMQTMLTLPQTAAIRDRDSQGRTTGPRKSSPPPLGLWPRMDAMSQPIRKRETPKESEPLPPLPSSSDSGPSPRRSLESPPTSPRDRPGGPRRPSATIPKPRPPPLDLSKGKTRVQPIVINTYQ